MRFSDERRCRPCRDGRKKCDGEKPSCRRCVRLGKQCYGYRAAFSTFNAENMYASREVSRPKGARAKAKPPVMTSGLTPDILSEAIAYYMQYYLGPANVPTAAMSDLRKAVLFTTHSTDLMEAALSAAALAVFERVRCERRVARQAAASYRRSLKALQSALPHVGEDGVGSCLLAIFFMARYEDTVLGECTESNHENERSLQSRVHLNGAIAVLDRWKNMPGAAQKPSFPVTYARRMLVKAALSGQIDLPTWLEDGSNFGEQDLELSLDGMLVRLVALRKSVTCLRKAASEAEARSPANLQAAGVLKRQALSIEKALRGCRCVCAKPAELAHTEAEVAEDVRWYSYRMIACHLRMQTLELHQLHSSHGLCTQIMDAKRELNAGAEALWTAIVAYLDGCSGQDHTNAMDDSNMCFKGAVLPHDSEEVVFPLMIALTTPGIDSRYMELFRMQLQNIGQSTGYGLVLAIASSPQV